MTYRKLVIGVLLLGLGVAAFAAYRAVQREGNPAELGRAEWQRLTQRFKRRAALAQEIEQHGGHGAQPEVPSPAAPSPAGRPAVPAIPTRLPRPAPDPERLAVQHEQYLARRPKPVVELQPFRVTDSAPIEGPAGRRGTATLTNLNPAVNAWYLLETEWEGASRESYHLANARPERRDLALDPAFPHGLLLVDSGARVPCDLWSPDAPLSLEAAATRRTPYVTLCGDEVALRLKTAGNRTTKELATDFLRDNIWGGERLTVFVRRTFFADAYLNTSDVTATAGWSATGPGTAGLAGWPRPARVAPENVGRSVHAAGLGIALEGADAARVTVGTWYPARHNPDVWVSAIQPGLVAGEILAGHRDVAGPLDEVERSALAYMIAFDLDEFEVAFSIGTDHPRVGWSERVPEQVRDPALPGPDGIGTIAPLVATGIIPAAVAPRTAATFTGGFKRSHGAFRTSELAFRNSGTHYGFIESGVVLSKLRPGLSTIFALEDGRVEMKTWTADDDALLERIRFARQNGLPIVEPDPETGEPVPGRKVSRWGEGNWSGSEDKKFRTLRAGACLLEQGDARFLVYGYFSSATPSAMARVFQAYGCRYAMLLDMNALEHTYLALYHVDDGGLRVQHLIDGMNVLDKSVGGVVLPRFLGFADNRDFFFLLRRPLPAVPDAAPGAVPADGEAAGAGDA